MRLGAVFSQESGSWKPK